MLFLCAIRIFWFLVLSLPLSLSLSLVQLLFSVFSFQKLSVGILSSHLHSGRTKVFLGFFVCANFVCSSLRRKVGKTHTHGLLEINVVQRSSPVLAEEFVYQGSSFCGSFWNWRGDEKESVGKHGCGWEPSGEGSEGSANGEGSRPGRSEGQEEAHLSILACWSSGSPPPPPPLPPFLLSLSPSHILPFFIISSPLLFASLQQSEMGTPCNKDRSTECNVSWVF